MTRTKLFNARDLVRSLAVALGIFAGCWNAPLPAAQSLDDSVGREGENAEADVLTVQVLLNQVPAEQGGPRELLVPDGENGPATMAAIAAFQQKHFDTADSRVDPRGRTLAKLNEVVEAQPFAQRVTRVALGEQKFWKNGQRTETSPRVATRLQAYWDATDQHFPIERFRDREFQRKWPWSAACVSWIVKRAGGGNDFAYSDSHYVYTAAAKRNRVRGSSNPFKAYDAATAVPAVGDIIVNERAGDNVTYANVDDGNVYKTHGDIVVAVQDDQVIAIGGNVSNSVRATIAELNADGTLKADRYFAVIKRH